MRTYATSLFRFQDSQDAEAPVHTPEELDEIFHAVSSATKSMRSTTVKPDEARLLGSVSFPDAPVVVRYVAQALIDYGHEFPDIPVSGAALMGHQRLADAWATQRDQYQWLAKHAADLHLRYQGESNWCAQRVLQIWQNSTKRPEPYLGAGPHAARRRYMALEPAQRLVQRYRDSLEKIRLRLKKLRDRPAAVEKIKPSPQKLRAQQHRRSRVLGAIYGRFVQFMQHRLRGPGRCSQQHRTLDPSTDTAYQEG